MTPGSILIYVHPPFYRVRGEIFFDIQAQNGLRLWAENFPVVRVMAPLVDAAEAPADARPLQPFLDANPRVEPVMLPRRGTRAFLQRDLWAGRRVIRDRIAASQYLVFGFSGYIGDWGTVACRTAARMGRPYAVFKDGVAHRVLRVSQQKLRRSALQRLRHGAETRLMKHSDRQVVRGSALALLHGQDTMDYYGRFARVPHRVDDIHISKADRITPEALAARLDRRAPEPLRVAYAGRVEEIKGPGAWTEAVARTRQAGIDITARWYGTGTLYEAEKAAVAARGLETFVTFAGFVPHARVLAELRQADLFVFTHMTEESPRCLIEALSAGLPIVGFDSAFPRDLLGDSQAGLLVPRGDVAALSAALVALARDPARLRAMSLDARRVAEPLNDEDVFRDRATIIKEVLGPHP